MKKIGIILRLILLCGLACLPSLTAAQPVLTKSATPVTALPRHPADFTSPAKGSSSFPDPTAGTFLVVSPPEWYPQLQPLLQWKREQGFRVEWMAVGLNKRDTIRNRLLARYQASTPLRPPQRYVLLVGDVDRIQSFVGQHTPSQLSATPTDLYYGEYTGDYLPEALVGRLSVADSHELAAVVQKIVSYGQGTLSHAASRILAVAGRESRPPAPATTNAQVDSLVAMAARHRPPLDVATVYNTDTATLAHLLCLLQRPYDLISYTGHGIRSGWNDPTFTALMADTLQGFAPTVMVNNCCMTNAFDGLCFGEQMLRSLRGAVGVIGAANETLWDEDYYWATALPGAFDTLLASADNPYDYPSQTLGRMLYNGCKAVSLVGSVFDAYYWEAYCLLGDPSMVPILGPQDSLWVHVDSLPLMGDSRLQVTTLPWARVSVTSDSLLLGTALADSLGRAEIALWEALSADSLTLTVVRPQGKPCRTTVAVARPTQGCLAVTGHRADTLLHICLQNVGQDSATDAYMTLTVGQETDTLFLPAFASGDTLTARLPLSPSWCGSVMEGLLTVEAPRLRTTTLDLLLEPLNPSLPPQVASIAVLTRDSLPVQVLLPGERYLLALDFVSPPDNLRVGVNGICNAFADTASRYLVPFRLSDSLRVEVTLSAISPCGELHDHFWLLGYRNRETFASGTLDAYPWQNDSAYPWQLDAPAPEGPWCIRSAPLPDAMKSVIAIDLDVLVADSVSFLLNASSEASDWLYFYVDGRRYGYWSGATGWKRFARRLTPGHHRLEWHYAKDPSVAERDDCARLDNICFPLCRWDKPYGTPIPDSTLAISQLSTLNAQLSISPNPVSDILTVSCSAGTAQVEVLDVMGRSVGQFPVCGTARWSTRHLPAGVYWLVFRTPNAPPRLAKFIVTK